MTTRAKSHPDFAAIGSLIGLVSGLAVVLFSGNYFEAAAGGIIAGFNLGALLLRSMYLNHHPYHVWKRPYPRTPMPKGYKLR